VATAALTFTLELQTMNFLSTTVALRAELIVREHAIDLLEGFLKEVETAADVSLPLTRYKLLHEIARANKKFDKIEDLIKEAI